MKRILKIWFKWFLLFDVIIASYLLLMYRDNTNVFEKLTDRSQTNFIVIHHTASSRNIQLIDYYNFHKTERQFNSIAYTFIIDKFGVIQQLHSITEKTDHVGEMNYCSIGVCLEGDFNSEHPSVMQQISLIVLVNYLCIEFNLSKENVFPHSYFGSTDCPGQNFNFNNFLKYIL